jgi:uncharacterized integral membrane protein (TIGR00697 family)
VTRSLGQFGVIVRFKNMPIKIAKPKKVSYIYYDLIVGCSVAVLLISNIAAVKLISFGPIITDGGAIIFPLSYIISDILTEVYGYAYARRAIWLAFALMLIAIISFKIVGYLPSAEEWNNQAAYNDILGFVARIAIASLIAFLFGQFLNSFVIAKLKIRTKGKRLWLRLIGSTAVGELIDTIIFAFIAFGGIIHGFVMFKYIFIGWVFKLSIEVILLPLSYKIILKLKRLEHIDRYDYKTNFTPFSIKLD